MVKRGLLGFFWSTGLDRLEDLAVLGEALDASLRRALGVGRLGLDRLLLRFHEELLKMDDERIIGCPGNGQVKAWICAERVELLASLGMCLRFGQALLYGH